MKYETYKKLPQMMQSPRLRYLIQLNYNHV